MAYAQKEKEWKGKPNFLHSSVDDKKLPYTYEYYVAFYEKSYIKRGWDEKR
jgi:hypothetical protein